MKTICEIHGYDGKSERFLLIEEIENSEDVLIKLRVKKKYIELIMEETDSKHESMEEILRKPIERKAKKLEPK